LDAKATSGSATLSLPQVDSSSDIHPLLNHCPPLPPSMVLDPRLPLALAVVGAAAPMVVATVVIATTAVAVVVAVAATAAPMAPLH
jgi:hypothetical protein